MDNDLADVGLAALDALEAQDETDTSTNTEASDEEDTSDTAEETDTGNDTESDESESTEDNAESDDTDDTEETEPEEKHELTDEEFEELAKKRGYAKQEEQKPEQPNKMEELLKKPAEVSEEDWEHTPEENKIVYNSLPYMEAVGKDGKVVRVKLPEQLPDDFEFASKKFEKRFDNDLIAQENRAREMLTAIKNAKKQSEEQAERASNAQRIITEIEGLQKKGDLPTPKAKPGTKEFDTDPAVEIINKVLNYQIQRAKDGVNLTVRDSLMLYKAEHPDEFAKKEAKGDIERANVAKKVAGNSKSAGTAVNKDSGKKAEYYRVGMSTEDVLDRILDDME